jgi:hypothetical protein
MFKKFECLGKISTNVNEVHHEIKRSSEMQLIMQSENCITQLFSRTLDKIVKDALHMS